MQQRELEFPFESMRQHKYAENVDPAEVDFERFIRALNKELRRFDRNTFWDVKSVSLELN